MKICWECGTDISDRGNRSDLCKDCQLLRTKELQDIRNRRTLGSPTLYKELHDGRLIPDDHNCGVNKGGQYPKKQSNWMNYEVIRGIPLDNESKERSRILRGG